MNTAEPQLHHPGIHARADGTRPAVIMAESGTTLTYRQLEDRSCQLAHMLRARGLAVGDHIAVLLGNEPAFVEACWAAQRAGLYLSPVNYHLTASEIGYVIADCSARALITGKAMDESPGLKDYLPELEVQLAVGTDVPGFESYEEAIARYPATPLPDETEGFLMFYSSGVTGRPKGILRPLSGVLFGAGETELSMLLQFAYGVSASSVYLSPAPLYHAAALRWIMAAHRIGCTVIVMEHFDAESALRSVELYQATHAQFVPTHFVRMLKLSPEIRQRYDLSSLQAAVHASAPCSVEVKRAIMDWWGPIVHEYYSGSESNGFCAIGPEDWLTHPGSVGRALVGKVHITDASGNELKAGETGLIWFEGGPSFDYHNDREQTARAYNSQGWSTLGDVGHLDKEGFLYLTDRASNLIIRGGVNIYPREIEDILILHPEVADVAVLGTPDPDLGEQVMAVIHPSEIRDAGPDLEARLMDFCAERIPRYKRPVSIRFVESLPRMPSGKLMKRTLGNGG